MTMNIPLNVIEPRGARYNSGMIWLHWATALLVLTLFLSAEIWDFTEKGGALRNGLKALHYGAGITLFAVFLLRLVWRIASLKTLPEEEKGVLGLMAKAVHYLLYFGLAAQISLGFLWRWSQGKPVDFFGLFSIPDLIGISPDYRHLLGDMHSLLAWVIIGAATLHAVAAIFHHAVLKDGVLMKMMPGR
ncbi:cytochrome b [Agrobacterium vitis]|uniref:cytochrome b n=1 Tax=Allorhizobium ampelinum TaxID=3025782 RepID=UPI001F3FCE89|nr:cytochrome b [Allorhizobium ampelinum]MCF1461405.1 cytochrome b [Allorhizobium ampelinum]